MSDFCDSLSLACTEAVAVVAIDSRKSRLAADGFRKCHEALMLFGYVGFPSDLKDEFSQRTQLSSVGCSRVFAEKLGGGVGTDRAEMDRLIEFLRPGDIVVVANLERLASSTAKLLEIGSLIQDSGAALRSIADPWCDTTAPNGRSVLAVVAGVVDFERSLTASRTLKAAKVSKRLGRPMGRPPKLCPEQLLLARSLIGQGETIRAIAGPILGCHAATLYRALADTKATKSRLSDTRDSLEIEALQVLATRALPRLRLSEEAEDDGATGTLYIGGIEIGPRREDADIDHNDARRFRAEDDC